MLLRSRFLVFFSAVLFVALDAEIATSGTARIPVVSDENWKAVAEVVPSNSRTHSFAFDDAPDGSGAARSHSPRKFESLGVRGVNFDLDGNVPYIICEEYDNAACPHGKCPEKTKKCYLEGEQTKLGCFATWLFNSSATHYDTSNMQFGLKGCWHEHMSNDGECLSEDICEADVRQAGKDETQRSLFCCCRTHNCNHKGIVVDPIHPVTKSPLPPAPEVPEVSFLEMFHTTDIWYVFVVLGILIFTGIVSLIAYYRYRERRYMKATCGHHANASHLPLISSECNDETLLSTVDPTPLSENRTPLPTTFVLGELIKQGRFGKIVKATWQTQGAFETVACKVFAYDDADSFMKEIGIFRTPLVDSNPFVVRYIAHESLCDESGVESNRIYTEYHPNGSLHDYLKAHVLSLTESFRMMTTIMEGLAFLHEEVRREHVLKPIIVHRDFKSKNVLVKRDLSTCIADFGLSMIFESNRKPTGEKETVHTQVGTRRYMSPEVLEGATEFTPMAFRQVDVYAAGLVIWEVLSRTRLSDEDDVGPYADPFHDIEPKLGEFRKYIKVLKQRPPIRPALEENIYTRPVVDTVREMWYQEPDGRVASGCVRERFQACHERFLRADSVSIDSSCP
ncbi:hypothetical protein QR680_013150 [Steinernema hermaphroditum]|uniref:Serine/threonine-protein kinase receptor n=1 Tax=Steinernema hermaphroditum TaxID=289476 RepID=A0AA39I6K5_9BILA|nr:hypothetical protein QR680_013150 [Steinernema hermaphroditum]